MILGILRSALKVYPGTYQQISEAVVPLETGIIPAEVFSNVIALPMLETELEHYWQILPLYNNNKEESTSAVISRVVASGLIFDKGNDELLSKLFLRRHTRIVISNAILQHPKA